LSKYPIKKKLSDGSEILIRKMTTDDVEKSLAFFQGLPFEERQYLRIDVTKRENIINRMNPGPFRWIWRIVAELDGDIVADATVSSRRSGWKRHVSDIRCIIHPDYQKKGLGMMLIRELFQKVLTEKGEMAYCEVMSEQKSAVKALEKLGFKREIVRPNHVKDINGELHDLYIYTKDVVQMWNTLQYHMDVYDCEYPRA